MEYSEYDVRSLYQNNITEKNLGDATKARVKKSLLERCDVEENSNCIKFLLLKMGFRKDPEARIRASSGDFLTTFEGNTYESYEIDIPSKGIGLGGYIKMTIGLYISNDLSVNEERIFVDLIGT